jgi:hypothetical protein
MMKKILFTQQRNLAICALVFAVSGSIGSAQADERGDLEQLRATTLSLIEALVETGAITRERADRLIGEAERKAKERAVQVAPAVPAGDVTKDGKRTVRVPYVPESVKQDIRDQVKQEVMAQAKEERWASPGALPEWLDRFQFEGDLRLRFDGYRLDPSNTAPGVAGYTGTSGLTRAPDFVGANGNLTGVPSTNTQEDFNRTRLRARFGFNAKVSDLVTAGMRISSGSTSGPTSTNQTLGQGFNKYSLVLDRAFVTLQPTPTVALSGGRIANPFMSTDLVWADDLGFEGFVASYKPKIAPNFGAFVTGGWFPLRTDNPLQTAPRNLTGGQAGIDWKFTQHTDLKLAVAMYRYHGIEGTLETNARYGLPSASDYGTRFEYANGLRQRGNTLFVVNALADPLTGTTYWGLASEFREFDLTGSLDISAFGSNHIVLTGDYVKNLAFDRADIARRTSSTIIDGRDYGYLGRVLVGRPVMAESGDWNISLAYRWLGSDAVVDAFTNSDFGLGGTNNKGYILGGSYAFDKHSWVSVRWMASELIDSMAPKVSGSSIAPTKLSTDLLQVDLNVKF